MARVALARRWAAWARLCSPGLLDAGWEPEGLSVAEVDPDRRRVLEAALPRGARRPEPGVGGGRRRLVVVAVKPGDVVRALEQCSTTLPEQTLVLSIAAGVTLDTLEAAAPDRPVVRAMPNTAALVRKGAAAIAAGKHATDADLDLAERVLGAVGVVVRVPESLLDSVTGLSGSGPAYVFLVAEAMVEAGVLVGLPRDVAAKLVHQTLARRRHPARRRRRGARGAAGRGHLPGRHHRRRAPAARGARRAGRVPGGGGGGDRAVPRARPRRLLSHTIHLDTTAHRRYAPAQRG